MTWRPFLCMERLDSNLILKETKKTLVFSAWQISSKKLFPHWLQKQTIGAQTIKEGCIVSMLIIVSLSNHILFTSNNTSSEACHI